MNSFRYLIILGLLVGMSLLPASKNSAFANDEWQHGTTLFGDLKYPADFKHFNYVNPTAPKGGRVRISALGGFDSLNPFSFKGRPASIVGLTYDSLMTSSLDEPSSEYGLIAEAVSYPDDYSSVTYLLRKDAKWHDGKPITVEDVIYSLEAQKAAHPFYKAYYQNIVSAEQSGDRQVTFRFDQKGNRELPHITGQLQILPKHWWTAKDADGKQRDLKESTLEIPLTSGPYKIKEFSSGRSITLERVKDYWGESLPVNVGSNNFDTIVQEYFRDPTVAFEAFKGDQYDWRRENSSKLWAVGYDFPAVAEGRVVKEEFVTKNGQGMQAFAFNIRRDKFKDPKVRQALGLAFNFEWANENLFYGQYARTESFFSNTELAATGLPSEGELIFLEPLKDKVPSEVFTEEYKAPKASTRRDFRQNLRQAANLLKDAGWVVKDGVLQNAETKEKMDVEFLLVQPLFERVVLPYVENLKRLGINATVRTIDTAQYQNRLDKFDFDIIVNTWGQSLSPGNEQREFWGAKAATNEGSRNYVGIENEAVDELINKIIFAKDRTELVNATRALDRVLLWNHYVVPQWHIQMIRTARWNRFGHPEKLPEYSVGFPTIWWAKEQ